MKEIDKFDKNIKSISIEIIENIIVKIYNQKPNRNIIKSKVDKYLESHKNG